MLLRVRPSRCSTIRLMLYGPAKLLWLCCTIRTNAVSGHVIVLCVLSSATCLDLGFSAVYSHRCSLTSSSCYQTSSLLWLCCTLSKRHSLTLLCKDLRKDIAFTVLCTLCFCALCQLRQRRACCALPTSLPTTPVCDLATLLKIVSPGLTLQSALSTCFSLGSLYQRFLLRAPVCSLGDARMQPLLIHSLVRYSYF
jgi:hypothetical protein